MSFSSYLALASGIGLAFGCTSPSPEPKFKQILRSMLNCLPEVHVDTVPFRPSVQSRITAKKIPHPKCFSFELSDFFCNFFDQNFPNV
jgi:hypothetical protein